MNNEHNPIAQLITQIQQKWAEEITPNSHYKFVRWLIKPAETRLYEGFLHLEATPHGKLSEIFITLLPSFESKEKYSRDLIKSWLEAYNKDQEIFKNLSKGTNEFNWKAVEFEEKLLAGEAIKVSTFYDMVASFRDALRMPDRKLTVVLMPPAVKDIDGYKNWLSELLKNGIGSGIQFCFFDYVDQRHFDDVVRSDKTNATKDLRLPLDLDGAINKIIQTGDPNSPEVQLRKYIVKMSEAVTRKDLTEFNRLGQQCLDLMTGSKIKSLMASAYIVYAGMLFNFKKYERIDTLLHKGLGIAEAGRDNGDPACQPLIMQFHGYIASNYQLTKKYRAAIQWFCKQAETAIETGLRLPAITAFRQAAYLAKRYDLAQYREILERNFLTGKGLTKEELEYSDFCFTGLEYYNLLYENREIDTAVAVDMTMTDVYGKDWKIQTTEKSRLFQKKSSALKESHYVAG